MIISISTRFAGVALGGAMAVTATLANAAGYSDPVVTPPVGTPGYSENGICEPESLIRRGVNLYFADPDCSCGGEEDRIVTLDGQKKAVLRHDLWVGSEVSCGSTGGEGITGNPNNGSVGGGALDGPSGGDSIGLN